MPNISGRFTGRTTLQTNMSVDDSPGHELSLAQIEGSNAVNDEKWKDVRITYCVSSDLIQGSGQQRGYFINQHPNGDRDCGTSEAKVTNNNGQITFEGTWRYTQGKGQFAGIQGNGTFNGRMTSPSEFDISWEGNYQLATQTRAA
jgi:hypothetical protein